MRDSTRGVQMSLITFIFCFSREEKSNLIFFSFFFLLLGFEYQHKIHYYNKWIPRIYGSKLLSYPMPGSVLYFTKINWSVSFHMKKIKYKFFLPPYGKNKVIDIFKYYC